MLHRKPAITTLVDSSLCLFSFTRLGTLCPFCVFIYSHICFYIFTYIVYIVMLQFVFLLLCGAFLRVQWINPNGIESKFSCVQPLAKHLAVWKSLAFLTLRNFGRKCPLCDVTKVAPPPHQDGARTGVSDQMTTVDL